MRDAKRGKSGRKLRMLHKMLKRLTPEDVLELSRSKKDRNYYEYNSNNSDNNNKYTNNSPRNNLKQERTNPPEIGECHYLYMFLLLLCL